MDNAEQLRHQLQTQIVEIINKKMEAGVMNQDRAKQIASLILEKLPEGISYDKLMEIIPTLDDHFEELTTVVVPIMMEYEKKMHSAVDAKVSELVKAGKLDEALKATQEGIEQEKKLS